VRPAWSVILFTTVTGAAQGLVVMLALLVITGLPVAERFVGNGLLVAVMMLLAGLVASFFHLGRPERAWRAAAMWRTSWLSREVIVLPLFMAVVGLWWLLLQLGEAPGWVSQAMSLWVPAGALLLATLLWFCTAMIYACLRFVQEWAHPLTVAVFGVLGLASGALLLATLAWASGENALAFALVPPVAVLLLAAWAVRVALIWRNRRLRPASTLASATGISGAPLKQTSMGFTGGSFNTHEFFHGGSAATLLRANVALHTLGFVLPLIVLGFVQAGVPIGWLLLALVSHAAGLIAERWLFFAQARHPQNLYYAKT
jgi:sulfite dehydrogenase (quinone) subunit SoeC